MHAYLVVLICLLATAAAPPAAAQFPLADDVDTPDSIVEAAYRAIEREPGAPFNWDRFRSLFIEEAMLVPNTEQTGGTFTVLSPEGFIAWIDGVTVVGGPNDHGFTEESVHNIVHRYGDIAHVLSTYQKRFWDDEEILGRGVNSFQLVRNGGRWWITSIIWDEEVGAGPIPSDLFP